ncbi:MAG: hypothetical protein HZB16_07430 [Armatimonadetes bacterium]|nr:hypothetical protein [Armatimonadota bacterium]
MTETLDRCVLRGGEQAELVLVTAPQVPDALAVRALLGHKGGVWEYHIDQALAGELEGLETRFYLALVGGRAVSNVMTVESGGVGILGHVWTVPEQRRQGLCDAIFAVLQPHFLARGGRRLLLGTGYDSPPYHIYLRHGWRPILERRGFMDWQPVPTPAAGPPTRVVPYAWRHWPALAPLFADGGADGLQALGFRYFGPENFEWPGLDLRQRVAERDDTFAFVAEAQDGRPVGLVVQAPDARWQGNTNVDLVCLPGSEAALGMMLAALPAAEGKRQCWLPSVSAPRRAALEAAGWRLEATLAAQLPNGGDVVVYRGR